MAETNVNESFKSEDGGLQGLIDDVTSMRGILDARIRRLNTNVDAIEAAWTGDAAKNYNQLQHKVNEHARSLNRTLEWIHDALSGSKKNFASHEDERKAGVQRVAASSALDNY